MDKLKFVTAGQPIRTAGAGYKRAFEILEEMNLDGMELEFVHGVRMTEQNQNLVKQLAKEKNLVLTAHGPYYINLNSKEEEKIEASIQRILETAVMGQELGAYSVTYHAAFYMGMDKKEVYKKVEKAMVKICEALDENKIDIWVRPETTGKPTQWGDLDEIIQLSKTCKQILPCVDFAHLHARTNGLFNTYDDFCGIFEKIGKELGDNALNNFHAHLAGIEYTIKGERRHLPLQESDMNYKDLLKAFKKFDIKGVLVCESPNIEDDAVLIKEYYNSL